MKTNVDAAVRILKNEIIRIFEQHADSDGWIETGTISHYFGYSPTLANGHHKGYFLGALLQELIDEGIIEVIRSGLGGVPNKHRLIRNSDS